MKQLMKDRFIQVMTVVTFILMVTVNALANILPINGISSGAVSDSYFNLFAPIGFTFSIWGVIYTLLLAFTVYQAVTFFRGGFVGRENIRRIAIIFSLTSLVNSAWIFAWHYNRIGLALMLMALLLIGLILINLILKDSILTTTEKLMVRLPFSIYFGWITVASIANVTTYLVSIGWNRFGIDEGIVTIVVLTVGVVIGMTAVYTYKDIAYGLVLLWAYSGILAKHLSPQYFNGQYGLVVVALLVLLAFMAVFELYMVVRLKNQKHNHAYA